MQAALPRSRPQTPEEPATKKPRLNAQAKRKRSKKIALPEPCSAEDVLWKDVQTLLGKEAVEVAIAEGSEREAPFIDWEVLEVDVVAITSDGRGIARSPPTRKPWAVIVPFTLPGEKVQVKICRHDRLHSYADLLSVVEPNVELRDQSRIKCRYFTQCGGCQYQMLSYDTQLGYKRDVIVKAYHHFSGLQGSAMPHIQPTIGSPLQYAYRTKITPHFQAPKKNWEPTGDGAKPEWLQIGFNMAGRNKVLDIEECPIATEVLNETLTHIRAKVVENIGTYKKGATLLLRDSLDVSLPLPPPGASSNELAAAFDKHVCVTDPKANIRERVGETVFEYNANSFFQNNNSILPHLTDYIREAIFPPTPLENSKRPTHLIDAYCGAGLFSIALYKHFTKTTGIELSAESIESAKHNAVINHIPAERCAFRKGDAVGIFDFQDAGDFKPETTAIVIDPPRKGCDEPFIKQLVAFRPSTIAYVSCNVHTQARDVGMILKATEDSEPGQRYVLESIRGFDLFPQTAHVESVAILRLV